MSHFTVAIICDNISDIEKLLAPYQENNCGDCPKEFLKFYDVEEEYRKEWEEGLQSDGTPFKEMYSTFEEFMKDWHGYKGPDENGKWGYWENPNAKWDWWKIGGRWMGLLLIKNNKEGTLGSPGVFNNEIGNTPKDYKWVDVCKVSDVCWEKMKEIAKFELLKDEPEDGDIWDILTRKIEDDKIRLKYTYYKPEYYIEKYGNKENYIKSQISFSTYAVITPDGKWHAPGDMGWFGLSSETKEEQKKFEDNFYKNFIEPYQDRFIAIIDCHI